MMKPKHWMMGAVLASLWACGSPEQATVEQFFRAARSNDSATLAAMSSVGSPGTVESWELVEITSQTTEPFTLPGLVAQLEAAEKERNANLEKGREYLAENQDAVDQITPKVAEDPDYKFDGALGEIQEEWSKLIEDRKATERSFQELKRAVDSETRLATKSVVREVDLAKLDGDVAVTEMVMMLKLEDAEEKPYTVALQKFDLSLPESDQTEASRWIIVDIKEKS